MAPRISLTKFVAAPPDVVWRIVTDLDRAPESMQGIRAIERVSGPEFGVGTTWRETRALFGRESTETMTVAAIDPGRSYTLEAASNGACYESKVTVEPTDGGTTLGMSFTAEATSLLGRVIAETAGRLFLPLTRRAIASDLDDLARTAESDAGRPNPGGQSG